MEDIKMQDATTSLKKTSTKPEQDLYMRMKELESELEIL